MSTKRSGGRSKKAKAPRPERVTVKGYTRKYPKARTGGGSSKKKGGKTGQGSLF